MTFNVGWICKECGPVAESKKRSIAKVQYDCCKICGGIVQSWVRPIRERAGRCFKCGHGSFMLSLEKGEIIRHCKECKTRQEAEE